MSENMSKNKPIESNYNALVEAISGIGKASEQFNASELKESIQQMGALFNSTKPDKPKNPRRRLCPVVCCCKCGKHNKTLYKYGNKKICKDCRKEVLK